MENIWTRTRFAKNKGPDSDDSSNIDETHNLIQELMPRVTIIAFGFIAGLVSSLAISGLILIVEKVTAVPVGTFYMVIIAAITNSQLYSVNMIVLGLLLHLICGSIIGVLMALPFINYKKNSIKTLYQYAPVFGLLFGLALWSIMFLPMTYWLVLPLISSLENQTIEQQVPTGPVASIDNSKLLGMSNKIIYGALSFNMLYGLLGAIIIKSLSEDYLHRKQSLRKPLKEPTN